MIPRLLPPTLPTNSWRSAPLVRPLPSVGGGWNHAQNLSTQKVGETHRQRDIGVSIHQVIARQNVGNPASDSGGTTKQTSVSQHSSLRSLEEDPDDARFQHMRGLILRQKASENKRQKSTISHVLRGDDNKKPRNFMRKLVDTYNPKKDIGKGYDRELRRDMKRDIKTALRRGKIDTDAAEIMKKTVNRLK